MTTHQNPKRCFAAVSSQFIIILYLSLIGALLLYMAFLMLVDPLIRKPDAYTQPLHNEEENEVGENESGLLLPGDVFLLSAITFYT